MDHDTPNDGTRNNPNDEGTQTALAGLGGVRLDLFDSAWFAEAAKATKPTPEQSAQAAEVEEIDADLQQALPLSDDELGVRALAAARRFGKYKCPELEHLAGLPWLRSSRAYCEHPEACEHVAAYDTETLIDRVEWVHRHRCRGLSELDLAIQREWTVRALGTGYFYGRQNPWLPTQLVELAGARSLHRRTLLAALCLSMVRGNIGICISAPEAFKLWGIPAATWWRQIAWLEDRGLLVRMRRWKNNEPSDNPDEPPRAPVQLCPNWYGPGPALVEQRAKVLAAFGVGDVDDVQASHDAMIEQRRERARELRRRALDRDADHTPPGRPAPAWALALATSAYLSRRDDYACERGRALAAGTFDVTVEGAFDPEPPDDQPDPELDAELERLGPAELTPRELHGLAVDVEDAREAAVPEPPASRVGAHGGATVLPVSRGGRSRETVTVSLGDGAPPGTKLNATQGPAAAETGSTVAPPCAPTRDAGGSATAAGATSATPVADAWSRLDFDERTVQPCPFDDYLAAKAGDNRARPRGSNGARAAALEGDGRKSGAPPGGGVVRKAARSELGRAVDDVAKRNPELARMIAQCLLGGPK